MNPGRVRVLPDALVGRIAAGEVVDRPGSVVKELVENALDAGATRVRVEVEGSMLGLIRVADDGSGIEADDLPVAVQRHATSKIQEPEDLEAIASLGFRGEGLAAVGAVSRLRIVSRTADAELGAAIPVDGGRIGATEPAARDVGTTVEVRDLFFNTPARKAFQKSPAAEIRYVSQLLTAYASARPEVDVSFVVEGRQSMHLPRAEDRHGRAVQILGREHVGRMMPVLIEEPDLSVEGFLGAPEDSRARGTHQVFLINGRWVFSPVLKVAVREAYGDLIPPARHPEAYLELTLPGDEIDVNVHPTKREVRLRRERELYPRLIRLLSGVVAKHVPSLSLEGPRSVGRPSYPFPPPDPAPSVRPPTLALVSETDSVPPLAGDRPAGSWEHRSVSGAESEEDDRPAMASMWQLHETYILAAIENALLVIDQHAAHERVLFEQALERLQGSSAPSQELLFPLVVELTPDEFTLLLEVHGTLESLGFHLERFGGTTVLVHAIPVGLREWRHGGLLRDVLDHFVDLPTSLDVHERVARSVACQGAVKAGQKLSLEEMNALVDQLFATSKPEGDPHGRPVYMRVGLSELHRRFGRSG